jgi:hypothetical protein
MAVACLAPKCHLKQAEYCGTISARPPDPNETRFFKLPADGRVSVFEIYRAGFDKDGTPIRPTVTVYSADRNRFRVKHGTVSMPEALARDTPLQTRITGGQVVTDGHQHATTR